MNELHRANTLAWLHQRVINWRVVGQADPTNEFCLLLEVIHLQCLRLGIYFISYLKKTSNQFTKCLIACLQHSQVHVAQSNFVQIIQFPSLHAMTTQLPQHSPQTLILAFLHHNLVLECHQLHHSNPFLIQEFLNFGIFN